MLETMLAEFENELKGRIVPFWEKMRDDELGGFYGLLDFDLNLHRNAEKGCILNSRILWFFSNAYKLLKDEKCLSCAKWAFDFLESHCLDKTNGGVFWSLNADGTVLDSTKHTYNQAFAIYALINYYEISNDSKALETTVSLFNIIETKCRDKDGYLESFNAEFKPSENDKLSENGVIAGRTMNTLLHVLEAYTDLYRVTKDSAVGKCLRFILDVFSEKIWNPQKKRQEVFFDFNYNSLIDLYSYGHDIETSWLVDKCLDVLDDAAYRDRIAPITACIAEQIYNIAYKDHSLLNECERGVDNTTRIWWVQAETVVGFMNAYQKTGDRKFLDATADVWNYIKNYIADKREGSEWFWCVDKDRKPSSRQPIVEPWKCPYHNGRMCFEMIHRIKAVESGK